MPSTMCRMIAMAGVPRLNDTTSLCVSCHSQRRTMSPFASAAPLAAMYATISAAVEVPMATKPAMIASDSQWRRTFMIFSSGGSHRSSTGRLLTRGPHKEDDCRRDQEVQAAADPHDESAHLLVLQRGQRRDARCQL